jgi:hypothetical protein
MLRPEPAKVFGSQPIALSTSASTPPTTRATAVDPTPPGTTASGGPLEGGPPGLPPLVGPARRELPGPSVKLASVVLVLAVVIVVAGLIIEGFAGPSSTPAPSSVATAKGSPLRAIPGRPDLGPLISEGEPPDDIVNAVVLPYGSAPGTVSDNTESAESYDEQRLFTLGAAQQKIITFFQIELKAQGWQVQSTGPARNEPGWIEVLAQRAGSDGYYWQIGAVVAPTTFPSSGPGAKTGLTEFEVRLFQVSDSE